MPVPYASALISSKRPAEQLVDAADGAGAGVVGRADAYKPLDAQLVAAVGPLVERPLDERAVDGAVPQHAEQLVRVALPA